MNSRNHVLIGETRAPSKGGAVPAIWVPVSEDERGILDLASAALRTTRSSFLANSAVCFAHQCGFYPEGVAEVRTTPFWAPLPVRVTVEVVAVSFLSAVLLGLVQRAADYIVVVSDGKLHRIPVSEFILGATLRILRQRQPSEPALRQISLPVLDDLEAQRMAYRQ